MDFSLIITGTLQGLTKLQQLLFLKTENLMFMLEMTFMAEELTQVENFKLLSLSKKSLKEVFQLHYLDQPISMETWMDYSLIRSISRMTTNSGQVIIRSI